MFPFIFALLKTLPGVSDFLDALFGNNASRGGGRGNNVMPRRGGPAEGWRGGGIDSYRDRKFTYYPEF